MNSGSRRDDINGYPVLCVWEGSYAGEPKSRIPRMPGVSKRERASIRPGARMTEYKTLRVPATDYENAREAKKESETWGEFLQRCSQTRPEIVEYVDGKEIHGRLDDVYTEVQTVKEALRGMQE